MFKAAAPVPEEDYYAWDNDNILWSRQFPAYFRDLDTGELASAFNETKAQLGRYSSWPEIPRRVSEGSDGWGVDEQRSADNNIFSPFPFTCVVTHIFIFYVCLSSVV